MMEGLGRPAERGAGEAQLQSAQEVTAEPEGARGGTGQPKPLS